LMTIALPLATEDNGEKFVMDSTHQNNTPPKIAKV
jgi:hypothetical protein